MQGGNPPMNPTPKWSGEVLESSQYFHNQPSKLVFDRARPPHGPHSNGMMGFTNNLENITQQMGQMYVQNSQPKAGQAK